MDDIGDRFKDYESCWDFTLPRRLPLIIRVDGRAFHGLKLAKPFDSEFFAAMEATAHALCAEIQGARWAFFQSDEISIVARDDMSLQTQPWLGKRLSKMLSLSAACATAEFNDVRHKSARWADECVRSTRQFDARAFVLPSLDETINYCIWRQQDATRNSVQMAAHATFSHKQLHLKDQDDMKAMLLEAGKPWDDTPAHFKRGAIVSQIVVERVVPQTGQTCERREWRTHHEPPIFTQDREYLAALWDGPARLVKTEAVA